MSWLSENGWLGWLGLALVLAAVEAATVDFVFVMFAGGALAGAVAAGVGAPFVVQVLVAILVALLLLGIVRPVVRRHFLDTETAHRIGASGLVGSEAKVLETVTSDGGRVKLGGEVWSARLVANTHPCEAGTDVQVVAIQGATAIVAPTAYPTSDS